MTDPSSPESALAAAHRRVKEAAEKFERQQRRYARLAVEADAATAAARALLLELEAELEISREELQRLEQKPPVS